MATLSTLYLCFLAYRWTHECWPFVLPSQSFLSWFVINCMQHFLVLSDALEATIRHWGNIYKLYRLYIFYREGHHFVLYVLKGKATLHRTLHKLYSFLTVKQQTNKCCFQNQQQPNHAWGSAWLFYDLQCISGRQQWGQFGVAVFYSRANHMVCECDALEWCWLCILLQHCSGALGAPDSLGWQCVCRPRLLWTGGQGVGVGPRYDYIVIVSVLFMLRAVIAVVWLNIV